MNSRNGLIFALLSAATFGVSGPFAKSLIESGWSPGGAVFARVAGGALVMMVIAVATQWPRLRQVSAHTRTVLLYGVFAISGVQLCFFNAVQHLSVGVALLLEYLAPIIVIGWVWITKGARPSVQTLLGAAVAMIGAAVVIDVFGSAEISAVGVAWGLAAAACLAVYFVISERADGDLHPVVLAASGLTVSAMVIGALGLVGVLPLQFSASNAVVADHSVNVWLPVVVLVLVSTVIAYLTGIAAITLLGPTIGSLVALTEVLCAVLAAWILVGESVTALQAVGGAAIIAGLVLARLGQVAPNQIPADPMTNVMAEE
ncbi:MULTISPECIES: DMT family transporter [Rhodococcus]|uniref:EamA family transporter n=1 Tax=Rhodococcus TaxID=1827 RepID=UPI0007672DBF|nr:MULTISPECIES: DMT family transporter [Rhodococcus]MBO8145684.1 EamA family transporter [Rhodococcus erythropolis]MBY6383156.1 EamA family transporter [Rhodococcus erythropolis]MCW2296983.1 drug/metabolite transporter (DMT)-like permease [Rhodococcus erythropolis]MDI9905187.1 DMT family transporter [Rhodococcus sp. IEGM 1406]MDO1488027.1 EamA family transporter [Rhodococcus erythropolis]